VISDDETALEEFIESGSTDLSAFNAEMLKGIPSESEEEGSSITEIDTEPEIPQQEVSPKNEQKEGAMSGSDDSRDIDSLDLIADDSSKETESSEESQENKEPPKPSVVADVDDSWM